MFRLKILATALIIAICSLNGYAQTKELGLRLGNLTDFTFIYKKEMEANKFVRHRFGFFNSQLVKVGDQESVSFGVGYAIGIEKRKSINDKLLFIHGFEPSLSTNLNHVGDINVINFRPAIGYVLGFQYNINDAFYVNIETIPSISGNFTFIEENDNTYNINAGFSSNAVALTIAYRFDAKPK